MRFRVLGPLEVLSAEGWTAISAAKWRSLLACLLLRPGQLVPTESLVFELWGDNPPSTANNLVSIYVHRLKKVIGDTEGRMLVYRAPGYMLRVGPGDLDVQRFESLTAEGRSALAAANAERAAALLAEALGLWRGPLLADVLPSPLIETYAERIAELWFTTTELRLAADLECGAARQGEPADLLGSVEPPKNRPIEGFDRSASGLDRHRIPDRAQQKDVGRQILRRCQGRSDLGERTRAVGKSADKRPSGRVVVGVETGHGRG